MVSLQTYYICLNFIFYYIKIIFIFYYIKNKEGEQDDIGECYNIREKTKGLEAGEGRNYT